MNTLRLLRERVALALSDLIDDPQALAELVVPSQDPKFGDYQANVAMPLGKRLKKPPREIAQDVVDRLDVEAVCHPPQIAGPGFINLKLRDDWLADQLDQLSGDPDRLGVRPADAPHTIVIDYSSPNVAKPMHVGHIRSTVIGDSLYRILRFLGHRTISDNHVGDWGTQFGMIIYGYKHLRDVEVYREQPVEELSRLYRLVNQLVDYHQTKSDYVPAAEREIAHQQEAVEKLQAEPRPDDAKEQKKYDKRLRQSTAKLGELQRSLRDLERKLAAVEDNATLQQLADEHPDIGSAVLEETAKLHAGDKINRSLWEEFLAPCLDDIQKTYDRLGVSFNHTLGESFYHEQLPGVVDSLLALEIATKSEGAVCVFFEDQAAPMIVQKRDGAYLYATTDLATIRYRVEEFDPDAILYVVDHRQSLHFEQLFAVAHRWGYTNLDLRHIAFGTVLGKDKKPYKTRSGDAVGLTGLLDESVRRAHRIVCENDDQRKVPQLSDAQRKQVAEKVGIAAIKFADLAHNRTSDYEFDYDKMLATNGFTATYLQYSFARIKSIFAKGDISHESLRSIDASITLEHAAERALALEIIRFEEALTRVASEHFPHHLAAYLYDLATRFSDFFNACPVNQAPSEPLRHSRIRICDLTARTLQLGLALLGIEVVERM